ncbi:MAG TPA: hypothetical protein VFN48_05755, partial [Solirubrobacteraceae bacterium]|nr:hypothetical protein [Solirubrobacteraceae bacterium]
MSAIPDPGPTAPPGRPEGSPPDRQETGPVAEVKALPTKGLTPARRGGPRRSLADALVALELVSGDYATRAVAIARERGMSLERFLIAEGSITAEQAARALAEAYQLDHLDLATFAIDMA